MRRLLWAARIFLVSQSWLSVDTFSLFLTTRRRNRPLPYCSTSDKSTGRFTVTTTSQYNIESLQLQGSSTADFDFSSTREWERFYKIEQEQQQQLQKAQGKHDDDNVDTVTEWHSSVSMDQLIDLIPIHKDRVSDKDRVLRILMVGCGTSRLPDAIHERFPHAHLLLVDSSTTCIQLLEERYHANPQITTLCGNVLELSTILPPEWVQHTDCIYDKGLMDALLCSEGWNGMVETLLYEASTVLDQTMGSYVLVSYQLPPSTRAFIQKECGEGLNWTFGLPQNNKSRVELSRAVMLSHDD